MGIGCGGQFVLWYSNSYYFFINVLICYYVNVKSFDFCCNLDRGLLRLISCDENMEYKGQL